MNKKNNNFILMLEPNKFDYIYLGIILFFATLFVSQGSDMNVTVLHAKDLVSGILNGRFGNFYGDVFNKAIEGGYFNCKSGGMAANYNILLYIFLSIILLPMLIIEKISKSNIDLLYFTIYIKMIIVLLCFVGAYELYRLSLLFNSSKEHAKLIAYAFLTSPILLFGNVMICQLDIIPVVVMIYSLKFFIQKKYDKFAIIIGIAIALKGFSILIFLPLILLEEKRIIYLIRYLFFAMLPALFTRLLFINDPGYKQTKDYMNSLYGFNARLYAKHLQTTYVEASYFIILFIIICILCYLIKPKDLIDRIKCMVFFPLSIFVAFMLFVNWHPQWLVIASPLFVLAIMLAKDNKAILLTECGISVGYLALIGYIFERGEDNYMINNGILVKIFNHGYGGESFKQIFEKLKIPPELIVSLFCGCLIGFIIILAIDFFVKKEVVLNEKELKLERALMWIRPSFILIYIFASIFSFFHKI